MNRFLSFVLLLSFSALSYGQGLKGYRYWFDRDFQNAVDVVQDSETIQASLDVSGMAAGVHTFYIAVKDSADRWSSPVSRMFVKTTAAGQSVPLTDAVTYRYWIDRDYVNAVSGSSTDGTVAIDLDLASQPAGVHVLYFQACDDVGQWSSPVSRMFVKTTAAGQSVPLTDAVTYRYWIDRDYANAVSGSSTDGTVAIDLDLASQPAGVHVLYFQACDDAGQWSSPISKMFIKSVSAGNAGISDQITYEYWFDSDRTNLVTGTSPDGVVLLQIDCNSLSFGEHTLNFQAHDEAGRSTPVMTWTFTVAIDRGDVNQDGQINIGDVPALASFILGTEKQTYSFSDADMNQDGKIQVNDLVLLVNVILDSGSSDSSNGNAPMLASVRQNEGVVSFGIDNYQMFAGAQFDVHLAEGQNINSISSSDNTHVYAWRMIDANTARMISYSTRNDNFAQSDVISFTVGGGTTGNVEISNIILTDALSNTTASNSLQLDNVTGVEGAMCDESQSAAGSIYTVSGIRLENDADGDGVLPVRIYIHNNNVYLRQ